MTSQETAAQLRIPIASIGASAGGISALQAFFSALPPKVGAAFVVIVHLDPEHSSGLVNIIASHTSMPVHEVKGEEQLQSDHVYVIGPNRRLLITSDAISSAPFEEPRGRRAPIDLFFRSMAEQHGDGFAIILTGGGSDGTLGIRAVKEEGGIILVQDPNEAEFPSMPRNAIASGLADFVLPVREIAARIPELVRAKQKLAKTSLKPRDEEALRRILAFVKLKTGNDFTHYKQATVGRRLARRMQVVHANTLNEYLACLQSTNDEVQALLGDLLISVTSFFRDEAAFKTLAREVLHGLTQRSLGHGPVRIWVPGCATGEEVYSIAMLLHETAAQQDIHPDIQIFASDLDPGALVAARDGRYPIAIEGDVSEERLRRFFTRDRDHYLIKREIRDLVVFAQHSVLRDPPFSHLDLISCRNLLIYLDRALQNQVYTTFHYALRPGGYLFLGSSESIEGQTQFRTVDRESRIFQSVDGVRVLPSLPSFISGPIVAETSYTREPRPNSMTDHRQALEQQAPPSILVDDSHRMLNLSETAGRFVLQPAGPPSTFVADVVRPELRLDLQAGLHRAFEQGETTLTLPVPVRFNGHARKVGLYVRPLVRDGGAKTALVLFLEGGDVDPPADDTHQFDASSHLVTQLRNELSTTQAHLRTSRAQYETVTEELRASNEELQSINEEYRSTSEELETSKEELQSINEELQTLNNELKLKLDVVSRAHSDLQNLMSATDVATLFLTSNLRINRFTPKVAELFNIADGDEGRPITDFTHHLENVDLQKDVRKVLADLMPVERTLRSTDGRWFMMRIRLYRTLDDKIDGTVITFMDVTDQHEAEQRWAIRQRRITSELAHRVKSTLAIVQAVVSETLGTAQVSGDVQQTVGSRLNAIAKAHDLVVKNDWAIDVADIAREQLSAYSSDMPARISISGPAVTLPRELGISFGLVLHELASNAVKFGALSEPTGTLDLSWSVVETNDGKLLRLAWLEKGGATTRAAADAGFSDQLLRNCLPSNATLERKFLPEGLSCLVELPLPDQPPDGSTH